MATRPAAVFLGLLVTTCSARGPRSVASAGATTCSVGEHFTAGRGCVADGAARPTSPAPTASVAASPVHDAPRTAAPSDRCPREMGFIAGGTYKMEERGNTVTVQPFCLDLTEVTAEAYAQCVQSKKCSAEDLRCAPEATYGTVGKADHPVNCVDWNQAVTYCQAQSKRLPTEEEWEWAARGQEEAREYPWGEGDPRSKVCWSGATDRGGTCRVGEFVAGDARGGIHDLAGNVWEWTASKYGAKEKARVNRGGGWISNRAADLRTSNRYADDPENRTAYDGFRCAR